MKKILILLALCLLVSFQLVHAFYDPILGRWLTRDPLHEPGARMMRGTEPQSRDHDYGLTTQGYNPNLNQYYFHNQFFKLNSETYPELAPHYPEDFVNPYRFVGNDPVNWIDPFGLQRGGGISLRPEYDPGWNEFGGVGGGGAAVGLGIGVGVYGLWDWLWNENTEKGDDSCPNSEKNEDSENSLKKKPIETGQDALDQLEGVEKAQNDWKKGKRERPIDFIDKSKQRFKSRIKNYKTPQDFYDDFD